MECCDVPFSLLDDVGWLMHGRTVDQWPWAIRDVMEKGVRCSVRPPLAKKEKQLPKIEASKGEVNLKLGSLRRSLSVQK